MKYRLLTGLILFMVAAVASARECVVLLHGLSRTSNSMVRLEESLEQSGYAVINFDYPSRHKPVEELAATVIPEAMGKCVDADTLPINFVTHSLGGILVRYYFERHDPSRIKRVVMLGPPNRGSQVVDRLKDVPGFELLNGPAGMQLGTGQNDIPAELGPVNFETGIIAGTRSINLILSNFLPNPDDGKVSVHSTRVAGMCSFVALPVTHPLMMRDAEVIDQVIGFLRNGKFGHEAAENRCATERNAMR